MRKKCFKTAWFIVGQSGKFDSVLGILHKEKNLLDQISSLSYCNNAKKKISKLLKRLMMNVLLNDQIIKPNDKKFQASMYKKEKGCV